MAHLRLRDIDVNTNFAFREVNLHIAQIICKLTEKQETIWVPSPELETDGKQVLVRPPWHLQVTGSVEKDRHGVGLHTRETQISLENKRACFETNANKAKGYGCQCRA